MYKNRWKMELWNLKLILQVTLLFIIIPSGLTQSVLECPSSFLRIHNKCYYFSYHKATWQDSFWHCNELNATLAILPNKNQEHKLRSYLWSGFLVSSDWWLGGKYDWYQNKWKWAASGKPIIYEKFFEHNKYSNTPGWHCLILDPKSQYQWNSKLCTEKSRFICQVKLIPNDNKEQQSNELPLISFPTSKGDNDLDNLLQNDNHLPGFKRNKIHTKSRNNTNRPHLICPKGYRHVRKICYKFSKDEATWQDAYYSCEASNGTLAIVHNKRQDIALRRAADRMGLPMVKRWLGGRYDWEELAWKWAASGVIIQHQGNNSEQLRWHCLLWDPREQERWVSGSCIEKQHYICQTKVLKVIAQTKLRKPQNKKELNKKNAYLGYQIEMRYDNPQHKINRIN